MRRSRKDRATEAGAVASGDACAPVPVALLEGRRQLQAHERLAVEALDESGPEADVRKDAAGHILELGECPKPPRGQELLTRSEAVDAFLRVDHEDALGLVDA